jgi:hypothetical protein
MAKASYYCLYYDIPGSKRKALYFICYVVSDVVLRSYMCLVIYLAGQGLLCRKDKR